MWLWSSITCIIQFGIACTGAAVIFMMSYPYTVWTWVGYQTVSPMDGLGMRLHTVIKFSTWFMQYLMIYKACASQTWWQWSNVGLLIEKTACRPSYFRAQLNSKKRLLQSKELAMPTQGCILYIGVASDNCQCQWRHSVPYLCPISAETRLLTDSKQNGRGPPYCFAGCEAYLLTVLLQPELQLMYCTPTHSGLPNNAVHFTSSYVCT